MIFFTEGRKFSMTPNSITYDGTEVKEWGGVNKNLQAFIRGFNRFTNNNIDEETEVGTLSKEAKEWISKKSILGSSEAETFEDLIYFPVVNPETNKLNKNALDSAKGSYLSTAKIPETLKDGVKSYIEKLSKENFDINEYTIFLKQEKKPLKETKVNLNESVKGIIKDLFSGSFDDDVKEFKQEVKDIGSPEQRLKVVLKLSEAIAKLSYLRHNKSKIKNLVDGLADWARSTLKITSPDSTINSRLSKNLNDLNSLREKALAMKFDGDEEREEILEKIKDKEEEIRNKIKEEQEY